MVSFWKEKYVIKLTSIEAQFLFLRIYGSKTKNYMAQPVDTPFQQLSCIRDVCFAPLQYAFIGQPNNFLASFSNSKKQPLQCRKRQQKPNTKTFQRRYNHHSPCTTNVQTQLILDLKYQSRLHLQFLTSAILAKYGVLTKTGSLSLRSRTNRENGFDVQ